MAKNFYITTTLPYVNSDPHLGFALEIIQADVLARHYSQYGYDVFFNTGTDEHGLKIFKKAEENNMTPKEYCDIYAEKFKKLKSALNLSYTNFIRTTDDNHIKAAQHFWELCAKNGDIYKKNYKIKYCVGCEMEKTDSELEDGRCPIHPNQKIETIEEENYFFKYSKYQKKLLNLYKKNKNFVLPSSRQKEIEEFTKRGLEDFSVSRLKEKMPWGIPVPGDDRHVMYVWFDALVNYISTLGWPEDTKIFKKFWPGLQVAGKDNLRQQSSMWQAMLLSSGLPASSQIFIHGFITSNGQKMSKSLGNVIDPFDLVSKYGADAVRYYLLREIPSTEDGDFTIEKFEKRYNSDLASGIGNLVGRIRGITKNKEIEIKKADRKFAAEIKKAKRNYSKSLEAFRFNEALEHIWNLISYCDKYINDEKLWQNDDIGKISNLVNTLNEISGLLLVFLPDTALKIKEAMELEGKGFRYKKFTPLFPRLDTKPV